MKIRTEPFQITTTTTTEEPPELSWHLDGSDYNLGSGERTFFWYKNVPNKFIDSTFTWTKKAPGPDWVFVNSYEVGPTKKMRYNWTRSYSEE